MSHALFATVTAYFFNSVAIAESVGVNRINWRPSSALVPAPARVYGPVSARRARRSPPLLLKFGGGMRNFVNKVTFGSYIISLHVLDRENCVTCDVCKPTLEHEATIPPENLCARRIATAP